MEINPEARTPGEIRFTNKQAAVKLFMDVRTLDRRRKDGLISYSKDKRKIFFTQEDLDGYNDRLKRFDVK